MSITLLSMPYRELGWCMVSPEINLCKLMCLSKMNIWMPILSREEVMNGKTGGTESYQVLWSRLAKVQSSCGTIIVQDNRHNDVTMT